VTVNSGVIEIIACVCGGFLGLVAAGRFDRMTFFWGITTGVSVGWCFVDKSLVWLIPAALLLVVTLWSGRRARAAV
jgi:hypothetical protein